MNACVWLPGESLATTAPHSHHQQLLGDIMFLWPTGRPLETSESQHNYRHVPRYWANGANTSFFLQTTGASYSEHKSRVLVL